MAEYSSYWNIEIIARTSQVSRGIRLLSPIEHAICLEQKANWNAYQNGRRIFWGVPSCLRTLFWVFVFRFTNGKSSTTSQLEELEYLPDVTWIVCRFHFVSVFFHEELRSTKTEFSRQRSVFISSCVTVDNRFFAMIVEIFLLSAGSNEFWFQSVSFQNRQFQ